MPSGLAVTRLPPSTLSLAPRSGVWQTHRQQLFQFYPVPAGSLAGDRQRAIVSDADTMMKDGVALWRQSGVDCLPGGVYQNQSNTERLEQRQIMQ